MERKRAGNPGRQMAADLYAEVPELTPRGRIRSDSEGPSAGLTDNTRGTGTRNARFNPGDEARTPRLAPEMDRPGLWPQTPGRRTVRALKAGGPVTRGVPRGPAAAKAPKGRAPAAAPAVGRAGKPKLKSAPKAR